VAKSLEETMKMLDVKDKEEKTMGFGKDIEVQANHLLKIADQLTEEAGMKLGFNAD
jgi:hypothetical protein